MFHAGSCCPRPPTALLCCCTCLQVNTIIRETLSATDKERLSWTGNILLLSSSLQPELAPDLGGVTSYALLPLLQVGGVLGGWVGGW